VCKHNRIKRRQEYAAGPYLADEGKRRGSAKESATIVYRTLVDTIKVPEKDNFQVITDHARHEFSAGGECEFLAVRTVR